MGHGLAWRSSFATCPARLPMRPRAILIVSGHWETPGFMLTASPKPPLLFDYYGFPPHTYQLRYDAPGAPQLALRAAQLLRDAGFSAALDTQRGLDHGVFVPLKVMYPEADIPVVELSLERGLDAEPHLEAGRALAPLRDEGVLLLCAGMSFHNLRALGDRTRDHPLAAVRHVAGSGRVHVRQRTQCRICCTGRRHRPRASAIRAPNISCRCWWRRARPTCPAGAFTMSGCSRR